MNIGIYIPGLGEAYREESILKYAKRFINEYKWNQPGAESTYTLKQEKILLHVANIAEEEKNTTKVSVIAITPDGRESVIYVFYDSLYEGVLTTKFNNSSILRKSILLLLTLVRKLPHIFVCIFHSNKCFSAKKRFQSVYAVFLLIIMSAGGILLIPSFVTVIGNTNNLCAGVPAELKAYFENTFWTGLAHYIVAASLALLTIMPKMNSLITSLTVKLICIHYYLQTGDRKQALLGRLDHLLQFIAENESPNATFHIHACDFGALIAYDFLFPSGTTPAERVRQKVKSLCTISFPYEFISSYYPGYFNNRDNSMGTHLTHWYNIYSVPDFFSTNLRAVGINRLVNNDKSKIKARNMQYNVVPRGKTFFDFLFLFTFKSYYWDDSPDGASCLRLLVRAMLQDKMA